MVRCQGRSLFIIFINVTDDGIVLKTSTSADEMKLCKCGYGGRRWRNEKDLRRMYEWARDRQALFNVQNCFATHSGKGNVKLKYGMRE